MECHHLSGAELRFHTCHFRCFCLLTQMKNLRLGECRKLAQVAEILCLGLNLARLCSLCCEHWTHRGELGLVLCILGVN